MAGGGRLKRKPLVCRVEKICGINGMAADLARRGKGKEITGGVLHWIPLLSKRGLWSWCEVARTVLCRRGAIGNAGSTLQAVRTANSAAEADATRNQATPWPPLRKYRQNDISLPYQVLMMTRRFWLAGVDIWKLHQECVPRAVFGTVLSGGGGSLGLRGHEPFQTGKRQINGGSVHRSHGAAGGFAQGGNHGLAVEAEAGFVHRKDGAREGAAEERNLHDHRLPCQRGFECRWSRRQWSILPACRLRPRLQMNNIVVALAIT